MDAKGLPMRIRLDSSKPFKRPRCTEVGYVPQKGGALERARENELTRANPLILGGRTFPNGLPYRAITSISFRKLPAPTRSTRSLTASMSSRLMPLDSDSRAGADAGFFGS